MDDAERAFRDALHRVDSVKIPVPSLEPAEVERRPGFGRMMSRWLAAAAVLAVVAGLAVWALAGRGQTVAAVPDGRPTPAGSVMLTGATWMALEFYGQPAARPNGAVPYLLFEPDSTFFGGDECDQATAPVRVDTTEPLGTYRLVGNDLKIVLDSGKAIGCDAAEQQLVSKVLDSTRRVSREGDTLALLDQPGNVLARFRATAGHRTDTDGVGSTPTPTQPPRATDQPTPTEPPTRGTDVTPTMINRPAPDVWVRIRNASDVDFTKVQVNFYDKRVNYGDIRAGAESKYLHTLLAYRYAFVQLTAEGKEYRLQPVDYVGETELATGRYTYVLDLDGPRISLRLEVEK